MKTIIAGGREFQDYALLCAEANLLSITEVVCGGARGADNLGRDYANQADIPVVMFPADWNKNGKAAGPIRNKEMGDYADTLLAFWDGESRGTKHMIDYMQKLNKPVTIVRY